MELLYTAEARDQIERVMRVFQDYILESRHFDILYSEKIGYIYLDIDPKRKEVAERFCILIEDGEQLTRQLAYEKSIDIMEEVGHCIDPSEATALEQAEIKMRLLPYFLQLPEYRHLIESPPEKC